MCPFSGFRRRNLCWILASAIIIYNYVLINAKVTYVALRGKYIVPQHLFNDMTFETCLKKTEYPAFKPCYLMFSPSRKICSFFAAPSCNNPAVSLLLQNQTKDDTTVYMKVTHTSSSTADPTSQSFSVAPSITNFIPPFVTHVTSNTNPSIETVSTSAGTTLSPQTTLMHVSTSNLTPMSTNGDAAQGNPNSNPINPTPTGRVSQSIFETSPDTTYQNMITTSIETFDSAQLIFDSSEMTSSLLASILMTFSPGIMPTSGFLSYTYDTASERVSAEITAGFSLITNTVTMSSESLYPCNCQRSSLTGQELENSIASLRNELSVNKSNLSRTIRSKTSAPDDRPSATGIGMTGIAILVACLVSLVVSDFQQLCQHLKIMKENLMS